MCRPPNTNHSRSLDWQGKPGREDNTSGSRQSRQTDQISRGHFFSETHRLLFAGVARHSNHLSGGDSSRKWPALDAIKENQRRPVNTELFLIKSQLVFTGTEVALQSDHARDPVSLVCREILENCNIKLLSKVLSQHSCELNRNVFVTKRYYIFIGLK